MNGKEAHDERWHDDVAAYALDALDGSDAVQFESHLADCSTCRERLLWYRPAVDEIPVGVAQVTPRPELRARLMDIVDSEATVPLATSPAAPKQRRSWLPSFEGFAFRPAFAGFAVLLLLAAGVAGYELHDTGGDTTAAPETRSYTAEAAKGFDDVSAKLVVYGDSGELRVSDMPEAPSGTVYQAWIQDSDGSVRRSVTFGSLLDGGGSVAIPTGLEDAKRVMITREHDADSETPTEEPVLSARIA